TRLRGIGAHRDLESFYTVRMSVAVTDKTREQVAHIVDLIRPAVQQDGGDLELVEVTDDGVVHVRFHGACVGCPSSSMTLRIGIEQNLKNNLPEIQRVISVE
ncbi:MAG: NifU family protein, partial [Phycisphaerales bacterium]|nr:NifU family protein [Phycisphaerales bacterium]